METNLMEEPLNKERWGHIVKQSFGFSCIYLLFLILFSIISGTFINVFFDALINFRDSTVILTGILYFVVISVIFISLGIMLSNRLSNHFYKRILYVLPVTLLGLVIWYWNYNYTKDFNTEFGDWSWLGYTIYIYWAMPTLTAIKHYIANGTLVYLSIIPSILPGFMFLLGVWIRKNVNWTNHKNKIKVSPIVISGLLLMGIIISATIPKTTYFENNTYPNVDGATAAIPFGQELLQELQHVSVPESVELVNFHKSHGAYVNLIEKKADIIFVSGPSEDELELAKENHVQLKLTPIAKDAFVFLVHNQNKVDNLTTEQIKAIYQGQITNWSDVGGDDNKVSAYQRNENSGSQTFMVKQVMKGAAMQEPEKKQMVAGMAGLIETVAEYKNSRKSIGYSFYYFANEMHKNENVKFLSINGIPCNKETIISGEYPFTATLYAVTREGEPEDSPANRLLNWIVSKDGGKAIEKGGFVPLY